MQQSNHWAHAGASGAVTTGRPLGAHTQAAPQPLDARARERRGSHSTGPHASDGATTGARARAAGVGRRGKEFIPSGRHEFQQKSPRAHLDRRSFR